MLNIKGILQQCCVARWLPQLPAPLHLWFLFSVGLHGALETQSQDKTIWSTMLLMLYRRRLCFCEISQKYVIIFPYIFQDTVRWVVGLTPTSSEVCSWSFLCYLLFHHRFPFEHRFPFKHRFEWKALLHLQLWSVKRI